MTTKTKRRDPDQGNGAQKHVNVTDSIACKSGIVNHIKLGWLIFCRDCLISVACPSGWPAWANLHFWRLTGRIEALRQEVRYVA